MPRLFEIPTRVLSGLTIAAMGLLFACQAQAKPTERAGDASRAGQDVQVSLATALDRGAVLQGDDGTLHVQVTIKTPPVDGVATRTPTDMVVVLDRSGSMSGSKLHHAKEALRQLIGRLTPADRLGIVVYDTRGQVLSPLRYATSDAKRQFYQICDSIEEQGNTNMSDGLDLGQGLIERNREPNRPARLLLLSDGLANTGDSSLSGLTSRARRAIAKEYAVSTMGIGEDFDERLMTQLATAGAGAFYYLAKLETLPLFFDGELNTASSTVASGARLTFSTARGVTVVDAMGLNVIRRGSVTEVTLGSLYADHQRTVWLTLKVPAHAQGSLALGELSLEYRGKSGNANTLRQQLPRVGCVGDWDDYQRQVNKEVWERAVLEEEVSRSQERLGDAIATGTAADVDRELKAVIQHRKLARSLGSQKVEQALSQFESSASSAKAAQSYAPAAKNAAAKRQKSSGYMERNKGNYYKSDPSVGY